MDDLDKQLAQLQLLNNRDLSPKPHGLVKKVGPAVPPKPKKLQPQPNASNHNLYSNIKMTLDNPAILEQKLEALEHHKKVLENQQQRRLQLAAAGNRTGSNSDGYQYKPQPQVATAVAAPQSQSRPYKNGGSIHGDETVNASGAYGNAGKIYENQHMLYENMKLNDHGPGYGGEKDNDNDSGSSSATSGHVYSNYHHDSKGNDSGLIYSNILHGPRNGMDPYYEGGAQDELPPPPLDIPPPLNLVDHEYHTQTSEEDLPPPPSPVSSSYSELRRATDNTYPAMPTYPMSQGNYHHSNYQQLNISNMGNRQSDLMGNGGNHLIGGGVGSRGPSHMSNDLMMQQTYANSYQPDYGTYVPSSQGSSTYESIYEPINPRPPSQMSSRSNYSLYTPYVSGPQGIGGAGTVGGGLHTKLPNHKEAEVDVLTDLLVQSMDGSQDTDSYGICVTCGERVVGESSGCTAMEQIYHIACFTCCQCQINLQGKPFYALEGKPCCEEDYLNTLEKCSVCMKPILERILRATGKPYHPGCFCCVVCGKSLDGVPFTVDATNQNHCIEDFHKKFAPRCCVCRQPIMPEPGKEETVRVVALDRSFHVSCYKCEDCGLLLSSEAEGRGCFPLDDHILCKSCNAKRVQALTSHMSTEL